MAELNGRAKASVPKEGGYLPRFGLDEGPVTEVHAFWIAGMSCDGCSIAAVGCLLYTSPSPRDRQKSRMPSSA